MRRSVLATLAVLSLARVASAEPSSAPFLPRFDFETARPVPVPLEHGVIRFHMYGDAQFRGVVQSDVPLTTPASDRSQTSLGQKKLFIDWIRFDLRGSFSDKAELVVQADLPTGFVGDETRGVSAARVPRDTSNPLGADLRWLYLDVWTPVGLVRVGHQPNHIGMGLLANDGDHPALFGDYRKGDVSERVLLATKPGGKDGKLAVFLAGDMVYRDAFARYTDGDRAFQGLAGARWGEGVDQAAVVFAFRKQHRDRESTGSLTPFTEHLDVRVLDVSFRRAMRLPGRSTYVFGEGEAAFVWGTTDYVRTIDQTRAGEDEKIRAMGGAVRLGVAHERKYARSRYADTTFAIEWGYATGDANPMDGTTRRFAMNPNHKVGLVLFDHVLAWQSARAATNAKDPLLLNRPAPGADLLPTNGGVAGATYVNPTFVYRPFRELDLKGGMVIATATSDVVDPYRFAALGEVRNAQGGDPRRRDLGLELDGGVEWRFPVERQIAFTVGAQAGVLFPGGALADASGKKMPVQHLSMLRGGFGF